MKETKTCQIIGVYADYQIYYDYKEARRRGTNRKPYLTYKGDYYIDSNPTIEEAKLRVPKLAREYAEKTKS